MVTSLVMHSSFPPKRKHPPSDDEQFGGKRVRMYLLMPVPSPTHQRERTPLNEQIGGFLKDQVENRTTDFGHRVGTTAQTMRNFADHLRTQSGSPEAADMVDQGAAVVDRVGTYFKEGDLEDMVADAEAFSRERPWTVASIGVVAGLLAARVLKSTAERRRVLAADAEPFVDGVDLNGDARNNGVENKRRTSRMRGTRKNKRSKAASSNGR
jgi:hypothetical protein